MSIEQNLKDVLILHCFTNAKALLLIQAQSEDFRLYQQQVLKNCKAMAQAMLDRGYQLVSGLNM